MKQFVAIIATFWFVNLGMGSGLSITNAALMGQNPAEHYIMIQFDVAWENSWRLDFGPSNWDAAWVFIKYKSMGSNWKHVQLSADPAHHVAPAGATVNVPADGVGAYIYRAAAGSGANNFTSVQLRWYYNAAGLPDDADIDIKVLGIEMVYIPQAAFYAGDYNSSAYCFKQGSIDNDPWYISSEDPINCTNAVENGYYYQSGGNGGELPSGSTFTIPTAYPKGYNAFYMMKYELSQEQYRDFLNLLTREQQQRRVAEDISGTNVAHVYVLTQSSSQSMYNSIRCDASIPATGPVTFYCEATNDGVYNAINDNQTSGLGSLGYTDLAAYADWAGLRPLTELEFEKASRGTRVPIAGEFVWGNTSIKSDGEYSITSSLSPNSSITNGTIGVATGNANYSLTFTQIYPILRPGIFAYSSPNHTRQETGASYYGVMELSGNVAEIMVSVGRVTGYTFTGLNGNGSLNELGQADVDYWPGLNGNNMQPNQVYGGSIGVTTQPGVGTRGGSYASPVGFLKVSGRSDACIGNNTSLRGATFGIRVGRSAE